MWSALPLLAACADRVTGPPLAVCYSSIRPLVLVVTEYRAVDPTLTEGCVVFPANLSATDTVEYLLVPQATTETPDLTAGFKLVGGTTPVAAPTAPVARIALSQLAPLSPADQFHSLLR